MVKRKKQLHLALTDRTYDALSCASYELGDTRTGIVRRALQTFLLKGDFYRKGERKYHGN